MPVKLLENLAILVLVALAALRPIIAERYDSAASGFGVEVTGIADPSPVRTAVFDVLILAAALCGAIARAIRQDRHDRWTGLELGTAVVAVAGVVSCFFASNARLALNATIDWVCLPIAAMTLAPLLRARRRRQIVVTIVLSSACVNVWQIIDDRAFGWESTWQQYLESKESMWRAKGVPLDAPQVSLFERRLQANEAQGHFPHSNVASSYLVLCFLAAAGMAVAQWRNVRRSAEAALPVVTSLLAIALLVATGLTKSLGGFVSLGVSAGLLVVVLRWRRWIDVHRCKAFVLGGAAFVVVGMGVVGHGLYHGSLPGASLNFRWQYWTASSRLIADHPWTGVGRENFGRHYLLYKPIESSEEVTNPHNLFVQAASDWGIPGLVGLILLVAGAVRTLVRPRDREPAAPPPAVGDPFLRRRLPWLWGALGLAVVTVGRVTLLGSDDAPWLYYQTVTTAISWAIGFLVLAAGLGRLGTPTSDGRGLDWESYVAIGLFAFFVHEMINFALFVPGSAYPFFVLLGCLLAARTAEGGTDGRGAGGVGRWAPVWVSLTALIAVAFVLLVPVVRADRHLRRARDASRWAVSEDFSRHPTPRAYQLAADADPMDPTPAVERARWMMNVASIASLRPRALDLAEEALAQAIRRDPVNVQLWRSQLRLSLLRARESDLVRHYEKAIGAARRVLEMYPQSPADLVALADAQLEAGEATRRPALVEEAVETYRRALALDDRRPAWEIFQRLSRGERDRVTARIAQALRWPGT